MGNYKLTSERVYVDPRITLVGAGPGDPELISLKGIKALKSADVVIYDALVDESLLEYSPKHAPRVYVGSHRGDENFSQATVNRLMVDYAINFGHVVRLKGGDLFVFGRGYEELEYAAKYGIPTAIVPGISSAISVPGLQGIPVTHNGTSDSLWILSGSEEGTSLPAEMYRAAQSDATVVVLLAFNQLSEIVSIYQSSDKGQLPAAVIQNGSMKNEKIALGVIDDIEQVVQDTCISDDGPILLIFGDAVAKHNSFESIVGAVNTQCLYEKRK
ncbi:uroporphyrinogen-III C-methyltransferase [Olivibacter sitiensis]|uniref:uroporphyrinogen-III C-methyltransferase n=1 Tax=Olivibacter sitiensis TaxID=376470 RepID=UPI00041089B5|nr:uroporphyrinogen-III C-methyltransferase [Olivibacter sitiensis]